MTIIKQSTLIDSALRGMNSARMNLEVIANNIANMNTDGFKETSRPVENQTLTPQPSTNSTDLSNTNLVSNIADMIRYQNQYESNAMMIKVEKEMTDTLLNIYKKY